MDDYAHHPSALRKTIEGLRDFYPGRTDRGGLSCPIPIRRTSALLEDFAAAFGAADEVILHKIYASAREQFNGRSHRAGPV